MHSLFTLEKLPESPKCYLFIFYPSSNYKKGSSMGQLQIIQSKNKTKCIYESLCGWSLKKIKYETTSVSNISFLLIFS